jgi:hypothetical protein
MKTAMYGEPFVLHLPAGCRGLGCKCGIGQCPAPVAVILSVPGWAVYYCEEHSSLVLNPDEPFFDGETYRIPF